MIDLHTHTFFSDGSLIPSELVWRGKIKGYKAIAITDHADESNLDFLISRSLKVCKTLTRAYKINVIPGVELTYIPPELIGKFAKEAKKLGAKIVLVHGETEAENVPPGTNISAMIDEVDILAHPGKIEEGVVKLAKEKNVLLEITSRKAHAASNKHVAKLAKKMGSRLVLSTDTHNPEDLISDEEALEIIKNADLGKEDLKRMFQNAQELISCNT